MAWHASSSPSRDWQPQPAGNPSRSSIGLHGGLTTPVGHPPPPPPGGVVLSPPRGTLLGCGSFAGAGRGGRGGKSPFLAAFIIFQVHLPQLCASFTLDGTPYRTMTWCHSHACSIHSGVSAHTRTGTVMKMVTRFTQTAKARPSPGVGASGAHSCRRSPMNSGFAMMYAVSIAAPSQEWPLGSTQVVGLLAT